MTDETIPDKAAAQAEQIRNAYLEKAAERDLVPYAELIVEGLKRCLNLVSEAVKTDKETSAEILRAVVVLNHAYLEDFLRKLALSLLPIASEEILNRVPLAGSAGRVEKFQLGKLAEHRGKKIDDVLRESVSAHMEHSTFNSVTEIMSFLKSVDIRLPRREDKDASSKIPKLPVGDDTLALLDAMIKRRHHIVHRADKAKTHDGLQVIADSEVISWLAATVTFTLSLANENFMQQHSFEKFRKKIIEDWNLPPAVEEKQGSSSG
jgi:chorismate mutase